jgi:acyl carrier protein
MHHAAYDGTSLGQLLSRVEAEYSGQPQPKSTSFREVIKYLEGTKGTPTNDFWAQYLAGAEASTFPMVPEGYVPSAGTDMEHDLSVPTIKVEGFTLSTLIRVSWALVMSNNSASKDIVFAETLTGRSDDCDGLAEADGPLITTVPNRCKVEPNTELREVLEAMQIGMVEMIPFQQAGLQNIRFVSPDAAEACKFSCLVTIAPESVAQAKSAFGVTPVDGPPAPAIDYAISIQFVIGKDKALKIGVSYDQKLIDETQMKEMVNQFNHVLHQICEGGKYKVMDIEFQPELLIEEDVMSQSTVSSLADRRGANPGVLPPFGHGLDNGCGMLGNDMVSSPSTDSDHVNISQGAMAIDSVIDQASIIASVEREMRSLWSEILEIDAEEIGDDDSFFRIGGDSISAMRLVTTAEQRNISITVADVFHHPKFADLCDFAAQSRAASAEHHDVVELGADLSTPGDSLDLGEPVTGAVVTARSETSSTVLVSMDKPAEEVVITKMKATPVTKGVVIPASKPTLTRQDYEAFATLDLLELDREPVIEAVCSQLNVFPGDVADVFPATDYQAWAVSHGLMRSRGNTNYFLFRLHGNLDTFRLEQACRKMVESNPILRTLFTTLGSQVMQVVLRSYQIEFQRYGREHSADDSFVRWLVEQDTHREAFLSQSIVRFKLLRHALGHYVLVMRVSHAQYDGMSLPLLCQDLQKAYGGEDLAIRPSFGKFIHGGKIREDAAMRFWGELLEGSSMTEIVEHTGPAYRNNVDTMRTRQIPPIPTNVAGMTQATLVKAAWALVLAKMSGQRDVVFGNLVFGRNVPISGIEEISGPCINMIPVRVRLNEMDSIQDLLALVQEQHLSAMPHESLGFRNLIKNCTDWPTWARFSSVVQHQSLGRNVGQDFILGDDVRCEIGVLGPAYDSSDLWVQTTPMEDSFKVEIGSSSAVVSPKIAEILLDRFCTVLTIFGSIGNGRDHHLWELLARDHAPLIPIQSPIIDQVWNNVLPDAASIAWDEPYYMYWGDEIAPVRFLEEFAEHGIHLEVEDILGSPTKQQQMVLIAQVMAGERNGGAASNGATSKKEKRRSGGYHRTNVASPVSSPRDGVSSPTGRSFWVLDSPGKQYGGRGSGSSRGSSARGSPRMMSPKRPAPFGPQRSLPSRRHTSRDNSRPRGAWDMSPAAALSDRHIASAGISSPSMSAHSGRSHGYSRPRISRTATAAVDW